MRDEQERPIEPEGGEIVAPAGIPEGTPPHSTDDDVRVLGGVGGAMRDRDAHPHVLDEVNAADIRACLDLSRTSATGPASDWVNALRYRIGCVRWRAADALDLGELRAELASVHYTGPVVCVGPVSAASGQLKRFVEAGGGPA